MHRAMLSLSAAAALSAAATPASAAEPFTTRSASVALVANCPSAPLTSVCTPAYVLGSGDFGPGVTGIEDYKPTQLGLGAESYAILKPTRTSPSYGSAIAFNTTDPASDLPVLKAGAFTRADDLGRYATSYAFSSTLSAFTYTGTQALPLALVGDIDYLLTFAPIDYGAPLSAGSYPYSFGQLSARLVIGTEALYQGQRLQPDQLVCGTAGVLASGGGNSAIGGYASGWGGTTHNLSMTLDASSACGGGGPVMIQPGENFYVYAFLATLATHGATVNATNSFHVNFAPGTPLSVQEAFANYATPIGVPEPASWTLLIAGFGLTGAALRRRQRIAA